MQAFQFKLRIKKGLVNMTVDPSSLDPKQVKEN